MAMFAYDQVDVHVFDAQPAITGQAVHIQLRAPGKRECTVPGCGDELFLQQFEKYRFNPAPVRRGTESHSG